MDTSSIRPLQRKHQLSKLLFTAVSSCWLLQTPAQAGLQVLREWKAAPVLLQNVEFSPDGTRVLTASGGGVGQLWTLDGKPLAIMEGQRPPMFNAHFNNQGSQILTTGYDGSAWLWSKDGVLINKYQLHKAAVADTRFVGNSGDFVSSSDDGQVVLRNPQGLRTWSGIFPGTARQLVVSPQGNLVVSSSDNGWLHVMHLGNTKEAVRASTFQTPHGRMNQLSINADGTKIAAAGTDGTVTVWDLNGKLQFRLKATSKGWAGGGMFCKTPQGPFLTVGDDGVLKEWSLLGKQLAQLKLSTSSRLTKVDCAPNGQLAAVVGSQGELWIIEIKITTDQISTSRAL